MSVSGVGDLMLLTSPSDICVKSDISISVSGVGYLVLLTSPSDICVRSDISMSVSGVGDLVLLTSPSDICVKSDISISLSGVGYLVLLTSPSDICVRSDISMSVSGVEDLGASESPTSSTWMFGNIGVSVYESKHQLCRTPVNSTTCRTILLWSTNQIFADRDPGDAEGNVFTLFVSSRAG